MVPRKSSKGSDLTAIDRCDWMIALGNKGHLTEFLCPYSGRTRHSKSFTCFKLSPGQNAWHFLGRPSPLIPKSCLPRQSEMDNPCCTIVVLPFDLEPMDTNPVIDGLLQSDMPLAGQPKIHNFDHSGRLLLTDPTTGEIVNSGQTAVPELLRLLEVTRNPNIDFDSPEYQLHLLKTSPKIFIGRDVYQYFVDAHPPGVYHGKILSHLEDPDDGNFFTVNDSTT